MKVFKFFSGEYFYGVAAKTQNEAEQHLFEYLHKMPIDKVEEIHESKWNDKFIKMYENDDTEKGAFYVSIREAMCGNEPIIVFTNDDIG